MVSGAPLPQGFQTGKRGCRKQPFTPAEEYSAGMYTVGVRDHIMVAHSRRGEVFGASQGLHGATYVVSVEVEVEELDDHGIVADVGFLRELLRGVLDHLDGQNLDDHRAFEGKPATAECIARQIHRELGRRLPVRAGTTLAVTLEGSPISWARYRAPIRGATIPAESGIA
jgi:6-pyruvoyltetrahydropterin/6-carboxytetrahydropterin synthase